MKVRLLRIVFLCALVVAIGSNRAAAQVTSTWNGTTGNWSDATRWSTDPLFPNNGNGGNDYNAVINSGEVTLDQDIEIEGLTLGGANVAGDFDLQLNGLFNWIQGGMIGSGTTTISSGATLSMSSSGPKQLDRTLVNDGTATWTDNTNWQFSGGTFQNNGDFTTVVNSGQNDIDGSSGTINNAGTFTKQGAGLAIVQSTGVAFNNSGVVDVQAGTLALRSGTHTGDFTGTTGATLQFSGSNTFAASSDISGGMNVNYNFSGTHDGTTSTTGEVTIGTSANATINGPLTASVLNINGTAVLNGSVTAPGGMLGGGTLAGSADWNVTDTLNWQQGTMSGSGTTTIDSGATLSMSSSGPKQLDRTLVNDGTATWTDNTNWQFSGGSFQNNGDFTTVVNSGQQDINGSSGTINNAGTFTKQGAGVAIVQSTGVAFNNSGVVDIQAGTLALRSGTHTGDFTGATGATLQFSGSNTFAASSDISGGMNVNYNFSGTHDGTTSTTGEVTIGTSANATINGPLTASVLNINGTAVLNGSVTAPGAPSSAPVIYLGGTLSGSADLQIDNELNWATGTMAGTGETTISSTGTLTLSSTGGDNFLSRELVNDGAVEWTTYAFGAGHDLIFSNATFTNNGSFTAHAWGSVSTVFDVMGGLAGSTNVFSNTGTFTKTGGGSTVFRNNPGAGNSGVLFNNSGTVEVQEGTLQLLAGGTHTGDFTGATGTTLKFAGTHTFSANSDVSGGMNVDYSGTMQITGTLTSTTTGTTTLNGTVTGSGDWDVSGPWAWTGGTMSGSGTTIVANGSISGAGTKTLNDRILRSAGNIEWSEGNITTTGSSANLIVNGGFETPVIGQSFNTYYAGSTQLAPWEILSGSVDIVRTFWPANEGQNSLDLGGYSSGTLEQSFATVPGREYTLSFQYGNHPLNTNASGRINVIGTTTLLDSVLNHSSSTYPNMAWTPYTTTFIADSTTTTLRFTDLTNSSIGFALDAVSVMSTQTTSTIHVPDGTSFTIIGSGNKSLNANLQIDAGGTLLHTSTGTTTHTAGSFVNNGLVQVDAGTLQFNAGGTGNGEFVVAPGATLQFNGPGHNYTGGVTLNNGVFQLQNFELTNGTVQGTGTIDALTFTNSSNVAPGLSLGNAIGTFSITGDYAQTSDGKLDVDIEDLSTFDTLSIAGDANLGGTLTVTIPDDGSIEAGDSFEIITAGDILGTEFDDVITEGADGFFLAPVYSELSVALFTYNDGDMNRSGDGTADQDDVPAFALALTNPRNYRSQFGISAKEAGDIDGDGDCDVDDIDDFADLLGMSISQLTYQMQLALAVPEPSSVLILLGQALLLLRRRPTSQVFR